MTYRAAFQGVDCRIDTATFMVNGNSQHSGVVGECVCPENASIEGKMVITASAPGGECTGSLPIQLYSSALSRALFNPDYLLKAVIVFFVIAIIGVGIVAAAKG
jgi:hypothetical protein